MGVRLAALLLVLSTLAVGCGSESQPTLARQDTSQLIALTDRISAEDACAQARDIPEVRARALRLVDQGRVPDRLRAPLLAGVAALSARAPACVQPPANATAPVVDTTPPKPKHGSHGHRKGHKKDGHHD